MVECTYEQDPLRWSKVTLWLVYKFYMLFDDGLPGALQVRIKMQIKVHLEVSDGLRKVSDGRKKVSDGLGRSSVGLR